MKSATAPAPITETEERQLARELEYRRASGPPEGVRFYEAISRLMAQKSRRIAELEAERASAGASGDITADDLLANMSARPGCSWVATIRDVEEVVAAIRSQRIAAAGRAHDNSPPPASGTREVA